MRNNKPMTEGGRWSLGSFPTEFAVTIEQYQPPRPAVQPRFSSQSENAAALELFTESAAVERPEWQLQAACRGQGPATFFGTRGSNEWQHARRVCDGCPVREECLEYAIVTRQAYGMWGGLSERERRRIRAKRRRAA